VTYWRWRNVQAAYGSSSRADILEAARKLWPEECASELIEVGEGEPGKFYFRAEKANIFTEIEVSDRVLEEDPKRMVRRIANHVERRVEMIIARETGGKDWNAKPAVAARAERDEAQMTPPSWDVLRKKP
jgi:hypothetical protein